MTFEKVRYLWKFNDYEFPQFRYEYEPAQSLRAPHALAIGEPYGIDLLNGIPGLEEVAEETVRFSSFGAPVDINAELDAMMVALHAGLGKVWTRTDAPSDSPRWAWARLVEMPALTVTGLSFFETPTIARFARFTRWFSEDEIQVDNVVNVNGEEWNVNNPGALAIQQMIIQLTPVTSAGVPASFEILNLTNGYSFELARLSTATTERMRLDTRRYADEGDGLINGPRIEFSTDSGVTWVDDSASYVFPPISQKVASFQLEPGINLIKGLGVSPNVQVSFIFHEEFLR